MVYLFAVLQPGIYDQFEQIQSQHFERRYSEVTIASCPCLRRRRLDLRVPRDGWLAPSSRGLVERLRGKGRACDA